MSMKPLTAYKCPRCGAKPGQKCKGTAVGSHTDRVDARTRAENLTGPQQRMLDEVRRDGIRKYNGRARRTIAALEQAGLIEYDFDLRPSAMGSWTEVFTVRPSTEEGVS